MKNKIKFNFINKKVNNFYKFSLLNCVFALLFSLPSFFIYDRQDLSDIFSILRIFFTFLIFYFARDFLKFNKIVINFISFLLIFNSVLIVINFFYSDLGILIRSFTKEQYVFFKFSAFWGNYQLPSYLYITQLLFIRPLPKLHNISFLASLALSRSLLPVILGLYFLRILKIFRNKSFYGKLIMLFFLGIFIFIFISLMYETLNEYFQTQLLSILRYEDSSQVRTIDSNFRRLNSFQNIFVSLFGNNLSRFESFADVIEGGDSFYTRWFLGSGLITTILLESVKINLAFSLFLNKYMGFLFYIFMAYADFKGELILTSLALVYTLAIYNKNHISNKYEY